MGEALLATSGRRRVLVVDESRLQRKILTASLGRWGYEVLEADGGKQALEICKQTPPDFVISNWIMPEMDGLDLCRAFRAIPRDGYAYFFLLTAKSEKEEVIKGLEDGADDFLSKPVNAHELRARLMAGERILNIHQELAQKNVMVSETLNEIQSLYDAIDKDLKQARKIQQALVPQRHRKFGKSSVSLLLRPCGHVGGDLVGMFSPGDDRIGFYSIDVSGHGITSALMTAQVGGYLRGDYPEHNIAMERRFEQYFALRPPEEVAKLLNDRFADENGIDEYFTMAYGTVDLVSGRLRMVQAGHPHPLILRADGQAEFMGEGGVPIGLVAGMTYVGIETTLSPGDRVLFYSDGFTECIMQDGEMLEPEGLLKMVRGCDPLKGGADFLDDLYWQLNQFKSPDHGPDDDVSAALLEYEGL